MRRIAWFAAALLLAGPPASAEEHASDDGIHEHVAPHGGTLVALGDEFAHVEFVLEADTGQLTAYVLDGEAERGVRLRQPALPLEVRHEEGESSRTVFSLGGVANVMTGETLGDTSEFQVRHDRLQGLRAFSAVIARIEVKGQVFERVAFDFPEGNEGRPARPASSAGAAAPAGGADAR